MISVIYPHGYDADRKKKEAAKKYIIRNLQQLFKKNLRCEIEFSKERTAYKLKIYLIYGPTLLAMKRNKAFVQFFTADIFKVLPKYFGIEICKGIDVIKREKVTEHSFSIYHCPSTHHTAYSDTYLNQY